MYEPQNLIAWMTLGENQAPTSINFQSWLDGNELTIQQFNGQIDTDLTFAIIKNRRTLKSSVDL